jgi:ribonuclease J
MKITIHRGTNQIGGCITEIESSGYKVFIDFGEQLPGSKNDDNKLLQIDGLTCGDVSKSALFITHYHGDHIGKICDTVSDLPIYVGETALEIYKCLEKRLTHIPDKKEAEKHKKILDRLKIVKTFKPAQKIKSGEIVITPLFIDHSAFDAYMFIVEADGKRVLNTGDFRGHGLRGKTLVPVLQKYAQNIDYIISEGSNIERPDAALQTEQELQKDFEKHFRKNKFNFVIVSSTNIDRIFSLYHAAKKARRCFVCDTYQAEILKTVSEAHKQYTTFYDIDYEQETNPTGRFLELNRRGKKVFAFAGKLKPYLDKYGFCMLIRPNNSFKPLLDEYYKLDKTNIYYSMWNGYLDKSKQAFNPNFASFVKPFKYEFKHTSGHADIKTLGLLFDTVKPKCGIIPIHTEAPEKFKELFVGHNIILLQDGHTFDCLIPIFIPIKDGKRNYPSHIIVKMQEIPGHFAIEEKPSIKFPYSLHTEDSYSIHIQKKLKITFNKKIITDFKYIESRQENGIPQLWYDEEWAKDFFEFINWLVGSNKPPEVLEIHPPFINYPIFNDCGLSNGEFDYCKAFGKFLNIYNVFYNKFKDRYSETAVVIENRCGTKYKGGKFLLSTCTDILKLAGILYEKPDIKLKIVLDYPQIFSAIIDDDNKISMDSLEGAVEKIKSFNQELKKYIKVIGGIHMWGKLKNKNGKWNPHAGNLDTFFGNGKRFNELDDKEKDKALKLKHEFLKSVFDTFNDNIPRYFVPEVYLGSQNDLHSIVSDMEKEGFIFISNYMCIKNHTI